MAAQDPVIAIDTNVVVRFLVNDDREQARRARALIDGEAVFVATTVLLETEWVLRSAYQLLRQGLFDALRAFLDLPRVFAQGREGVGGGASLGRTRHGLRRRAPSRQRRRLRRLRELRSRA
jgi:predicted nucleic acid-binding protein